MLAVALILGVGFVALMVTAAFLFGRGAGGSRFTASQDVGDSPGTMSFWIPSSESPPSSSPDDPPMPETADSNSEQSEFGGSDFGGVDSGGGGSD